MKQLRFQTGAAFYCLILEQDLLRFRFSLVHVVHEHKQNDEHRKRQDQNKQG
ncbi:hypothetical protein [Alkalicoccus luteus]|uniref:Uncharacterized protein n=1 Tax=Alkalicoccus luteus TaxID=1237094 RepID=A0A969PSC2_9BACI|nr:hypothetical protein [Alkalicoccus luteus]NJP37501.1 hypothetical protein [Alkalicoccus luteus]